jgi:hypothetical protein
LSEAPDAHASFPSFFAAYAGSKQIALNETTKFIAENHPSFDVIHILPSVILGANELTTKRSEMLTGTNRYVVNIMIGNDAAAPMLGATVFVDDCAVLHVRALDERVAGNQNFLTSAGSITWADVKGIATKSFEKQIAEEGFKLNGKMDTRVLTLDVKKTDEEFGLKWTPFKEQVESVVAHYLASKKE